MKLICEADKKSWVKTIDKWTRKKYLEFFKLQAIEDAEKQEAAGREYLQSVIEDACLYDIHGTAHRLEEIWDIDFADVENAPEFDIAVEVFWGNAIHQAYKERAKLGNASRLG